MNNEKNLNYEFKYIENQLLISRTEYEWEKWIESKDKNKKLFHKSLDQKQNWETDNCNKPEEELFITLKCPECT
jgi:hypothetical protein